MQSLLPRVSRTPFPQQSSSRLRLGIVALLIAVPACAPTPVRTGPDTVRVAFDQNFPDPSIIGANAIDPATGTMKRTWYAFSTESGGQRIPSAKSTDLLNWTPTGDALLAPPTWADPRLTWAPSIIFSGAEYRLYYSIIASINGEHCVSVARSATPTGPFVDTSTGPVVCTPPGEGSIDPSPFVESDGSTWLVWSTEGNITRNRLILSGKLDPTGTYLLPGTEGTIFQGATNWESKIAEGPHFVRANGGLWLFYSGNDWKSTKYGVGVARCDTPRGPCTRYFDLPLLQTRNAMKGPGGPHLVVEPSGETFLAFHAWNGTVGYQNGGHRAMYLLTVYFEDGEPKLAGAPSAVPVPQ